MRIYLLLGDIAESHLVKFCSHISGRSKSHGFSKFADQSIELVLKLMKMSSTCLVDSLTDGPPADLRFRLTEYTEV